ncbi:MAG TPA: hypothetical protein VI455_07465 [Terriglobia bacterium]
MTTRLSRSISISVTSLVQATAMAAVSMLLAACHSKPKPVEEVPPVGYFSTRAEAQAAADQANASLAHSRATEKSAGVRDQDLPCGQYKAVSKNDSDGHPWWTTERAMTGCPSSALAPLSQPQPSGGQPR